MLKSLAYILQTTDPTRFALDQTRLYLNTYWLTLRFEIRHRLSAECFMPHRASFLACRLLRSIVAEQGSHKSRCLAA